MELLSVGLLTLASWSWPELTLAVLYSCTTVDMSLTVLPLCNQLLRLLSWHV